MCYITDVLAFFSENRPLFHYSEVSQHHFPKHFLNQGFTNSLNLDFLSENRDCLSLCGNLTKMPELCDKNISKL